MSLAIFKPLLLPLRPMEMRALLTLICTLGLLACSGGESTPPSDARASRLQDLSQLRHYLLLDKAYSNDQRALALRAISESETGNREWTAADFELQVARVVALADNGHSTVWRGPRAGRMNRIPARLLLLADGAFVVRAKGSGLSALGLRVDAIDGIATADILRRLRIYRGGPDNLRDHDNITLLESPQLLHAAGIAQSDHEVTLTISDQGHTRNLRLSALPAAPNEAPVEGLRFLAPQRLVKEDKEWQSAFKNTATPLWLEKPDQAFRLEPLAELRAVYLQLKINTNAADGERIGAFLKRARQFIAEGRPQNVILDMRFNGGGDYTKTAAFMSELPKMIPADGQIFVITHVTTFSAGISSVGFVEQAAPRQTIIVGEPIGDRLIFYGEPRDFILRNSGIGMSYATGLHDYLHGCRWFGPCYWVNWFYSISVPSLDPKMWAPLSFELIAAGRDPALEAIGLVLQPPPQLKDVSARSAQVAFGTGLR